MFQQSLLFINFLNGHLSEASETVYPKCHFCFFDKLKNEIQNFILRFYFNKEDEMQITDIHVY